MYRKYKLGAKPSPLDTRDYPISRLIATTSVFPETFCLDISKLKIKDQGEIGSCVAHSLSYVKELSEYAKTKLFNNFSVGFIYANRETTDYQGEGMVTREALNGLLKTGDVLQSVFPYNEEYPGIKNRLTSDIVKKAEPYKISAYARLNTNDDIKNALMKLGAVTICIPIYGSFYRTTQYSPLVPMFDETTESLLGYHEMTIVGWEERGWIVLNSWGINWADNGKCYLPFNFPIFEAWSATEELPQPEPQPEPKKYYRVQLGAFKNKSSAENLAAKLKALGYSTYIPLIDGLYKVQAFAFSNKDNAYIQRDKLRALGFTGAFVAYY